MKKRTPSRQAELIQVKISIMEMFKDHKLTMAEAFFIFEEIKYDSLTGSRFAILQKHGMVERSSDTMYR